MEPLSLQKIIDLSCSQLVQGAPDSMVMQVCTDTRKVSRGDLFVALVGENFDGNEFVEEAIAKGAAAVLVSTDCADRCDPSVGVIYTDDTLLALQKLAQGYRKMRAMKVVGITGSNGKTSTKDMVEAVLSSRYKVTATQGNYNNHIGLPLSILRADHSTEYGVFEMGMNHPGEITVLAGIAVADIAVITNAGLAHIGNMGSREAIAREKANLARAVASQGDVVLPAEDKMLAVLTDGVHAPITLTGMAKGEFTAKIQALGLEGSEFVVHEGGDDSASVHLPVAGEHMIRNALMAVAVGRLAGVSLDGCAAALSKVCLTRGRLDRREVAGVLFLDDSYNANPDSMAAAIATLGKLKCKGKKVAVLGEMGELGNQASEGYRQVGAEAALVGLDALIVVGESATGIAVSASACGMAHVYQSASIENAVEQLATLVTAEDVVLVKGSRAAGMERVLTEFELLGGAVTSS